jgi:hypothetical protein
MPDTKTNTGLGNSGDWNSGDRNSGYLNTTEPKVRIFNKETDLSRNEINFPSYFWFDLTEWICKSDMTFKEKEENEQYEVTGGYLKVYEYKEAWRRSWDKATDEDRRKTLNLPNWDNEIFKEISGIDVEKELNEITGLSDDEKEALELLRSKGFKITKE